MDALQVKSAPYAGPHWHRAGRYLLARSRSVNLNTQDRLCRFIARSLADGLLLRDARFVPDLRLSHSHGLSRTLVPEHQDLGHDADRDLLGRFRVQLESHRRMDPGDFLLGHPSLF